MAFVEKHIDDKFYMENEIRVSARNKLFREVIANMLIHREYSNAYPAKLIIEKGSVRNDYNPFIDSSSWNLFLAKKKEEVMTEFKIANLSTQQISPSLTL